MPIMMLEVSSPFIEVVDGFAVKECPQCHVSKDLQLFHRDKAMPDGRKVVCIECLRPAQRARENIGGVAADIPFNFHAMAR